MYLGATQTPVLIIMKEHFTQCSGAAYWCVLRAGSFIPFTGLFFTWVFFRLSSSAASSPTCLMSEAWPTGGESQCAAWRPISPRHRPAAQSTVLPTKCPGKARKPGRKGWRGWEMREKRNGGRELLSWREHREKTVHRVRLQPRACTHTHTSTQTHWQWHARTVSNLWSKRTECTGHELIVLHPYHHLHWESLFHSDLCLLITHIKENGPG